MRRTLSSITVEVLFPILLIGAICCGLVMSWLGKVPGRDGAPMSAGMLYLLTIIGAAAVLWMVITFVREARRVQVDDSALYVSNYVTEVRIPLSEVARVHEGTAHKRLDWIIIDLRHRSAFGKRIEFYPRLHMYPSGMHPVMRELKALCKQAGGENGAGATPFDPAEKIFEAGDDCVQIGEDYVLYGAEGKEEASDKDKFYFKDLDRITVLHSRKSGKITGIRYRVKGKAGAFSIDSYTPEEMEEIARLLESRAKHFPIKFLVKRSAGPSVAGLILTGLGAMAATVCSAWLLYFGWTTREMLQEPIGMGLYGVICLGALGVAAVLWTGLWRGMQE